MSQQTEDSLRMQFKSGDVIGVTWLKNHAHLTQDTIDELVNDGVLIKIEKDLSDKQSDDKYMLV